MRITESKHAVYAFVAALLLLCTATAVPAAESYRQTLNRIFAVDMAAPDYGAIKLKLDRIVDPTIDVEAELARIDAMAETVRGMLPPDASDWDKVKSIQRFIYEGGAWNDHRPFAYDHVDPLGRVVANKLLTTYVATRRGNCVSMPFLVIILGQRLGLNMSAALAPEHVLVRFTDEGGEAYNLEATSGAGATRDVWYRQQLPMTDAALANGLYLQTLNPHETVAVMASTVMEHFYAEGRYEDAIWVADLILRYHPRFALTMVKQSAAYYKLIERDYYAHYATIRDVPKAKRARLHQLLKGNDEALSGAENLGWRPSEGLISSGPRN